MARHEKSLLRLLTLFSFGCATISAFSGPSALKSVRITVSQKHNARKPSHKNLMLAAIPETTSAMLAVTPPSLQAISLACLLPSLLGYYKSEYGVSYAYGSAIAATAVLVLKQLGTVRSLAGIHALALLFYGVRLNMFLLYREWTIPVFSEFREKVEERAKRRGGRWKRTPFILSVSFLYACMAAPIMVSCTKLAGVVPSSTGWIRYALCRGLTLTTWFGFLLAAVGDFTKTWVKKKKGTDHLVTNGVFSKFRHPNYTGEMIGWTASALVPLALGVVSPWSVASLIGALGIDFVLVQATTGLEKKQKEKYGDSKEYQDWIASSWGGIVLKQ